VRRNACSALIAAEDIDAFPDMVPALADSDLVVRERALRGLRELLGDAALSALAAEIPAADARLRRMLVYALQRCDPQAGPLQALSLRDDPELAVRVAVAHALATSADATEVTRTLERLAADADADVRDAASASLEVRARDPDSRRLGEDG
jgi:HEAT repeat protein